MPAPHNVLLVEGKDDLFVVANLLKHHLAIDEVKNVLYIDKKDSITILLDKLRGDLQRSNLERLGVVIDADDSAANRWAALRHRLKNLGDITVPDLPDTPDIDGTICTAQRQDRTVKLGIWLMPDNQQAGMLEHFISSLIKPDDLLWPRARDCVNGIPADQRRFHPPHQIKAEVYTWLAWQKDPGNPFGVAIEARCLDAEAPRARHFVDWLRRLFDF